LRSPSRFNNLQHHENNLAMNNVTIGDYPETEEQYLDVEGTSVLGIEVNGNGILNAVSVLAHGEAKVYTGKEKSGMKNITPFTKAEAEAQVKKLEQKFKEVVGILADIGYLIEEMDRRKGWGEIGYKDYTEWASGRLGCERSFAYVYKNAAAFDMRSLESGDEELVQFSNQAALEHKAILVKVPKGKEREAIHKAKEVASAEGKKPTADHYKRVVDDILSRGVDEDSREVLTNEDIEFPVWRKTKNRSNIPTLEAALPYWRKLLEESRDDEIEGRKAERRINLIEERIEKLSRKGKPNASDSSSTGEQEVKGEIPELARAMTEEYLKELPSDDDQASALISSVEGDSRPHINAIAEQFPINQRSEALLEIEKVFAQKHEEYLKSIGVNASSETNSEESSGVGTAEESLAIASPDTAAPDNQDASTGGEESAEMETTGESLTPMLDTAATDNQAASAGGDESSGVGTTSESLAIASPDTAATDNQGASTSGEESSGVGTTSDRLLRTSPNAFFDCSSVEELKAYINEVDPGQIWEETQDLYKHWARLSEKVGDSETELEQKRIEVKELEKKVKEKDAELKEQEKLIQQLRSIVASLEGQIKEYQSLSASEEYEAPENQEF